METPQKRLKTKCNFGRLSLGPPSHGARSRTDGRTSRTQKVFSSGNYFLIFFEVVPRDERIRQDETLIKVNRTSVFQAKDKGSEDRDICGISCTEECRWLGYFIEK